MTNARLPMDIVVVRELGTSKNKANPKCQYFTKTKRSTLNPNPIRQVSFKEGKQRLLNADQAF